MAGFNHVKRCIELADRDIAFAMEERLVAKALLDRLAAISRPNDGGPKILLIFARMASQACDWIDGDLRIEIAGDQDASVIDVLTDMGAGMRERVFGSLRFNVPIEELARAVERVPHMIEPLTIAVKTARKVVLSATEGVRKSTMPPPMVEIDRESLYEVHPQPITAGDLRAPAVPSFAAQATPPSPPQEIAKPAEAQAPGALARPKIQIMKKTAPVAVKAPSVADGPIAKPAAVSPKPSPFGAPPAATPKVQPAPARAPAAKPSSDRPRFPSTTTAAATPVAKSMRPAAAQSAQKEKSQRPGALSKPPRGVSLSEPPDEEKIDTGWEDD